MIKKEIITSLKKYQRASQKKKNQYLKDFEFKMIYRTTKTENPETTRKIVIQALHDLAQKR